MSNVTTTCRDINELKANARDAVLLLFQECYKAGIKDIFITETYRSQERQKYLYAQGRTRPGNKVTWTLNSNHTPRLAWDIATSLSNNLYDIPTLNKVGTIAKKLGIEWGGYWKVPNYDAPHFQVSATWKAPSGYKLEGVVGIPTSSKEKITFKSSDNNNNTTQKPIQIEKEDDDKLKFSNSATKNAVRDFIKQSVDHKYIDASWLTKFDNGTLTGGDYDGLQIIVNNKKANSK